MDTDCVVLAAEAYDLLAVDDDEADKICLASTNEIFFSNLSLVISRCRCHSGHSLLNAGWLP